MAACDWIQFLRRRLSAPLRTRQTPPLARYHKYHEISHVEGVSYATSCCITINYVMGSGFLALPKAFADAGLLLASLVLFLSVLALRTTVMYEVEVMCRAEAWVKANLVPQVLKTPRTARRTSEQDMHLSQHAFQVTEMCELFGGRKLQLAYTAALASYNFFALWGYGAVFGDAMSTYAPVPFLGEVGAYRMYVVLFSLVVVPLSTMEIKEQATFQIFLTGLRLLIMVLMVGSIVASLDSDGEPFGPGTEEYVGTVPAVKWWGILRIIPAVVFALNMASASPTIVAALEHKNEVGGVVWMTMASAASMYALISVATAYYFGENVSGSCNVNWQSYAPGGEDAGSMDMISSAGRLLAYFVVLFPVIDVTSVYPLNVMVISNNMMAAIYHDHVDNAETDPVIIKSFRVAIAVPPLLCALVLRDFAKIVKYAGCLTVLVVFVFPAYLNLISQRMCTERFGGCKTPFTGRITSSTPVVVFFIIFGLALFAGLLVDDVIDVFSG